jgi:hypothetical protein
MDGWMDGAREMEDHILPDLFPEDLMRRFP